MTTLANSRKLCSYLKEKKSKSVIQQACVKSKRPKMDKMLTIENNTLTVLWDGIETKFSI